MHTKTQEEIRSSALIMLTAKAAEGCVPCLEGYKRAARNAGASEREIELATTAGKRAQEIALSNSTAAPAQDEALNNARAEVVTGADAVAFLAQAEADANVRILDRHFQQMGYKPVPEVQAMIRYQLDDRTCLQAYLPYQLDDTHTSYIDYHLGRNGVDLVGVVLDSTDTSPLEALLQPHESFIVQDGAVVSGHACDTNCWAQNTAQCCGPAAIGCLASGPVDLACLITFCGACAAFECFWCGCC